MATPGNSALGARFVCISREDGDELHLILKLLIITVIVAESLESRRAACWF